MVWEVDHAVNGIKTPLDFKYMKLLRFVMRIISAWPGKELNDPNIMRFEGIGYAYYNTSLAITYLILGLFYLKVNMPRLSFYELGHMYIVLLMNMVSVSRAFTLCLSKKYRAVAKQFVEKIHLFYHKDKSDYAMEIHEKVHRFSHIFAIYLTFLMIFALSLFNLIPVVNNYLTGKYKSRANLVNTTYEHAIYFLYPFNSDSNFNGYMVASVINWYGSYLCASSMCMFDLFLSLMVFNLWGHFKILINILGTFPRPAAENNGDGNNPAGAVMYSEAEQELIKIKLKECIEYHLFINDFANNMTDAFGMALFMYYTFHQISGCLLLLECSQMNVQALVRYVPMTCVMFQQLIQLSVIFETVGTMSEKLRDSVYCLPWECMNTKNRKTVLFYLVKVQDPVHINAGGLVVVGVRTMASIIKTSFSYFAFLRTVVH